jgi:hypothetical protein
VTTVDGASDISAERVEALREVGVPVFASGALSATWTDGASDAATAFSYERVTGGPGSLVLSEHPLPERPDARDGIGQGAFRLRRVDGGEEGDPTPAPYLLAVRLFVRDEARDEVRRWLDEEHVDLALAVAGAQWYAGYDDVDGSSYLNLWGIDDPALIESGAWIEARDTPWRLRLNASIPNQDRAVYRLAPSTESGSPDR